VELVERSVRKARGCRLERGDTLFVESVGTFMRSRGVVGLGLVGGIRGCGWGL